MGEPRHLFGYGSLVNRRSLGRALGRDVSPDELRPARLTGWRRTWDGAEQVLPDGHDSPIRAQFLDLARDDRAGARVNGILVAITDAERIALERRERGYERIDVTVDDGTRAITFAGRRDPGPRGEVVLREYVKLVEAGFAALGDDQVDEFRRTTDPIEAPILDGAYRFVDPRQNELTSWGTSRA